jgi:hypothetical protein
MHRGHRLPEQLREGPSIGRRCYDRRHPSPPGTPYRGPAALFSGRRLPIEENTMPNELTLDDIRRMAQDIGLTRLADEHLQQLLRATRTAQARRAALPAAELTPADEPAHVFRADAGTPQ